MSLCIVHPEVCKESAEELAAALKCSVSNPIAENRRDYTEYDTVFNYGCNRQLYTNNIVNSQRSVVRCIDKLITFRLLAKNNIPIPSFTENKEEVPAWWESIVCRSDRKGTQAKSLIYKEKGEDLPNSQLYTEYFNNKHEFRIVLFKGKIIARYLKERVGEDWNFILLDPDMFEKIDDACIKAASILGIDYVGFDVVSRSPHRFVILEANSGPILTPEVKKYLKKELK